MDFVKELALQLSIRLEQAAASRGAARCRQHHPFHRPLSQGGHRGLDEEQLRQLSELLEKLRALDERRQAILKSIDEQEQVDP